MRRLLNQAANAAVKVKGSIFEIVFRRLLPRLGYQQAIWAIAHRICRLIWKICIRVFVTTKGARDFGILNLAQFGILFWPTQ